jgi:fimbrial chaperone protein
MPCRLASTAVLASALVMGAEVARAAEVQVGPVLVNLSPAARSAIVTVRNQGKETARFELQARSWSQGPAGEMNLSPTEEIAVYPPVLTIAPGEERNIRVGAVVPFGPVEKTYRVILQELAPPEAPDSGVQVRMLTRMLLPVFLAPTVAVEKAVIEALAAKAGKVTFRLVNQGSVHVKPASVKLTGLAAGGKVAFESELPAWYVLSGGVRDYEATIPADACGTVQEFEASADLTREVVRARLVKPKACAP